MRFWMHRRVLPALLIVAFALGIAAVVGLVVDRIGPNTAEANVLAPSQSVNIDGPWEEILDMLVYTVQASDTNGPWSIVGANNPANRELWHEIVAYNCEARHMVEADFERMIPNESELWVPPWCVERFKAAYWACHDAPTTTERFEFDSTSTPRVPIDPVRSNRSIPGVAWMLLGFAAAGGALTSGSAYRRILSPSNAHPMRPVPLANATEAAEQIREQVVALTALQPDSADALSDLPQWMIVSAVRGLGNGGVESRFSDGTKRRENFVNEPCYRVLARRTNDGPTNGEERVFDIRIQCANQLVGLTGQFLLADYTFTPTADPVAMNIPFVAPPATPDPVPAPAVAEPEATPVTAPVVSGALPEPVATSRTITIVQGEGDEYTVTTPTCRATVNAPNGYEGETSEDGTITIKIAGQVFTNAPAPNPTA